MKVPTAQSPFEFLLVEDNLADIRMMEEILSEYEMPIHLSVARDGEEAMAHLHRAARDAAMPWPNLILLDLNLPKKHGREVLAEVKADSTLRRIPVIILTTSSAEQDINRSYDLHANCYITKPVQIDKFITVVQAINAFWLQIVELPKGRG